MQKKLTQLTGNVHGQRVPQRKKTQRNLYSINWRWGLAFTLGVTQILAFLDTNMSVSPMRNCCVGGLSQREDPMQMLLHHSGILA